MSFLFDCKKTSEISINEAKYFTGQTGDLKTQILAIGNNNAVCNINSIGVFKFMLNI